MEIFAHFINNNKQIKTIAEIDSECDSLSNILLENENLKNKYYVISPYYTGSSNDRTIIDEYIEDFDISIISNINTLILPHIFEPCYEQKEILDSLLNLKNIKYVYIDHKYKESDYLIILMRSYNFGLIEYIENERTSSFFYFQRLQYNE